MALAIVVTLAQDSVESYGLIAAGMAIGGAVGAVGARTVKMTAMPQMVALFNGVGGGAAALIALAEFRNLLPEPGRVSEEETVSIVISGLIGSISFSGSLVAFAKLQELVSGRPIVYPGQQVVDAALVAVAAGLGLVLLFGPQEQVLLVAPPLGRAHLRRPVRPADRRRRHAGGDLAAERLHGARSVRDGLRAPQHRSDRERALVGASGTLLTLLMGRAMNRSIGDVLFGAFGAVARAAAPTAGADGRTVRATTADDVAIMLAYARRVVFVPGYGLAVAQAQHDVRVLADLLEAKGVDVKYGIHPVAGRMPGHMNVLLAEANVPYDQLYEMEQINPGAAPDRRRRHPRRERCRESRRAQ